MEKNSLKEIDYSISVILQAAPYLNDITYLTTDGKTKHLTDKQKGYAWYYCYNNGVKVDAFRRAYLMRYSAKKRKLIEDKYLDSEFACSRAYGIHRKQHVQEAIRLIREHIDASIRSNIDITLLEQLQIQASYDPAMFVTPKGKPTFDSWEQIPPKYRCCVKNIVGGHYTQTGRWVETKVELVDRAQARKELLQIAPNLLQPTKMEVLHKTIDSTGKETGYNMRGMSDDDLREIIAKG